VSERERLQRLLAADAKRLSEINRFLVDPSNPLIGRLLEIVERHGGPRRSTARPRRRVGSRTCSPGSKRRNRPTAATSTG